MRTLRNTLLALVAALSLSVGASATANASGSSGPLCTVKSGEGWDHWLRTYPSPYGGTIEYLPPGATFRMHFEEDVSWGILWAYGHSAASFPTDGYFPRYKLSC